MSRIDDIAKLIQEKKYMTKKKEEIEEKLQQIEEELIGLRE